MKISENYPFYDFVWNFGFRDVSLLWWLWLVHLKCSVNCGWLIELYHYRQSDYKQISRKYMVFKPITFKKSVTFMINREITRDPIANYFKKHQRRFAAPNWTKNIKDVLKSPVARIFHYLYSHMYSEADRLVRLVAPSFARWPTNSSLDAWQFI